MANKIFNTIVIGSGTSAYFCITLLNEAGKKVAVIQPKKYLVANAEAMAMAHHLLGKGIDLAPRTNWEALQALKNEFLDGRSEGEVEDFKQAGVATFSGRATLVRNNELEVNGERLTAEHIVLATGASPRRTEIPGVEHTHDSE